MISITRAAAASAQLANRQVHFIYGGRAARDICGEPMLRCLPGFGERIHYHPAVSPGGTSEHDDPPWGGRVGFVPDVAKELFGETLPQFEIYFAGPPAMAEAVMRMVVEMKIPPAQVHYDQFY
jgi:toluene monooxygenase electron transfer component